MSFVSFASGEPTITAAELHAAAQKAGFKIPRDGQDEKDFLFFQNSFDAVAISVADLPDYVDPRLAPTPVQGGARKWTTVPTTSDPLNAWAYKCHLIASNPTSSILNGQRVIIKANVSVAGAPLNIGTSPHMFEGDEHPTSTIDATVVKRVLDAGAEIVGLGVCENFSLAGISITADSGPVHNAWAPAYVTGGSSSGNAGLISATDVREWQAAGRALPFPDPPIVEDSVDMGIGGDQAGSIRMPAHFSGIYGLKPTHGLVPYTGIAALHPMIDHVGPMARSIDDIARLLTVIAGADGIDPRQTPFTPLPASVPDYFSALHDWQKQKEAAGDWTSTAAGRGLRVGILTESLNVPNLSPSIKTLVQTSAARFTSLGATVTNISVPLHHLAPAIWTIATRSRVPSVLRNEVSDLLSHPLPHLAPKTPDQAFWDYMSHANPAVANTLLNAQILDSKHGPNLARKAYMHIHELIAAYDKAFEQVDVLIAPVTQKVAPKIPAALLDKRRRNEKQEGHPASASLPVAEVGDVTPGISARQGAEIAAGITLNTCPFNLSGHPALSMPCGWAQTEDGEGMLPVGMQVIGKRSGELVVGFARRASA